MNELIFEPLFQDAQQLEMRGQGLPLEHLVSRIPNQKLRNGSLPPLLSDTYADSPAGLLKVTDNKIVSNMQLDIFVIHELIVSHDC